MARSTRGRPKDEEKAAAILQAAGDQFVRFGMAGTKMESIAQEAGVSKLTIYNHFGTKEDLFQRVIQNKCQFFMNDELVAQLWDMDAESGLNAFGRGFCGILYSDEVIAMHRTVMGESRSDGGIAKLFYTSGPERIYELMCGYLECLEKRGEIKLDSLERAAELFLGLFTGLTHMRTVLETAPKPTQKELETFTRSNVRYFLKIFSTQTSRT